MVFAQSKPFPNRDLEVEQYQSDTKQHYELHLGNRVMNNFTDVNRLIELATTDPEALERLRQQQIEELISKAPEHVQRRLRGLQFQIDCQRSLHSDSPMGSCMAITKMMMDSLQKLNETLHGYDRDQELKDKAQAPRVLSFPVASGN